MPWNARIQRRLKLKDLNILLSVAQCGSMGKAARQLTLTQPGVSKALADLEHTIGVSLFDRTGQGVEATLYGRALLKWAAAVFDDLRQGINEIDFLNDHRGGEVRIGATEPIVAGLLPAIIAHLSHRYPLISFNVTQIFIIRSYDELRERKIDLMISRIPDNDLADDLDVEILADDPPFIVTGRKNPLLKRRKLTLADLSDQPWTLPRSDSEAGKLFANLFRDAGLELPRTRVIASSIQMHNALLAAAPFLAIYPRSLFHFTAKWLPVKMLPVELPHRPAPIGITTLKNRTISPVAHLVIETARTIVAQMKKGREFHVRESAASLG